MEHECQHFKEGVNSHLAEVRPTSSGQTLESALLELANRRAQNAINGLVYRANHLTVQCELDRHTLAINAKLIQAPNV